VARYPVTAAIAVQQQSTSAPFRSTKAPDAGQLHVQVSYTTDIPPVVPDRLHLESLPPAPLPNNIVPRCAMNPDYEYALPPHIAHLMAGADAHTEDLETPGIYPSISACAHTSGCHASINQLQTPMLAATQPLGTASLRPSLVRSQATRESSFKGCNAANSRTAPVSCGGPGGHLQESLAVESDESGGTVVVAPYMPPDSSTCMPPPCVSHAAAGASTAPVLTRDLDTGRVPEAAATEQPGENVREIELACVPPAGGFGGSGVQPRARGHAQQRRPRWRSLLAFAAGPSTAGGTVGEDGKVVPLTAQQLMVRLQRQLDGFRYGCQFLCRYEMLGPHQRRRGGAYA